MVVESLQRAVRVSTLLKNNKKTFVRKSKKWGFCITLKESKKKIKSKTDNDMVLTLFLNIA